MAERSGVLTGKQIQEFGLIENAKDECYQACSYDLRLGNEHYVSDEHGKWKLIYLTNDYRTFSEFQCRNRKIECKQFYPATDSDKNLVRYQKPESHTDVLTIPPFGTAIIELMEKVNTDKPLHFDNSELTPQVIVGRFDLKLSVIYKGLFSQQATQVEPGYYGYLYCFITSQSSEPVTLKLGEKIATIEFSFADNTYRDWVIDKTKDKANKKKNEYFQEGITDIRSFYLSKRIPKDSGLTPIYKKVTDSFAAEVDSHLKKTETIDMISKNVERNLNTKNSLIKAIFSFLEAAVIAFGGSYLFRLEAVLEEIAKDLDDHMPVLQNDTANLIDITKYSDKFQEWMSKSQVFLCLARILFVFFTVSGIIFLVKSIWNYFAFDFFPSRMNFREGKKKFNEYVDSQKQQSNDSTK